MVASLDGLDAELETSAALRKGAIGNRFHIHKQTVEGHLSGLRTMIDYLPE
jgi:hypothetical protein